MSAAQGWIGEPPPPREERPRGERYKWYLMMGAANYIPEAERFEDDDQE